MENFIIKTYFNFLTNTLVTSEKYINYTKCIKDTVFTNIAFLSNCFKKKIPF